MSFPKKLFEHFTLLSLSDNFLKFNFKGVELSELVLLFFFLWVLLELKPRDGLNRFLQLGITVDDYASGDLKGITGLLERFVQFEDVPI